jgi:hypothetical protein
VSAVLALFRIVATLSRPADGQLEVW